MNILLSALQFYIHLTCAEAIFLIHVKRKNKFLLRLVLSLAVLTGAVVGLSFLFTVLPQPTELINKLCMVLFFTCIVATSAGAIAVCFDMPFSGVAFAVAGGYSLEHIGNGLRSIIRYTVFQVFDDVPKPITESLIQQLPFFVVIIAAYLLLIRPATHKSELQMQNKGVIIVSFINLIVCIILSIFNSYGAGEPVNRFITSVICQVYAILSCGLCLGLQAGLFKQKSMSRERETLEQLFQVERDQHKLAKETIDLINIKSHDLRYQLSLLENTRDEQERKATISEISDAVLIYDAIAKTGNDALDVVLMEKTLLFDKHHIKFSYIVDGNKLDILRPSDIYSLFGNLLENAMESALKEDEDKRLISLNVRNERDMLFIHMDNYCGSNVTFVDGLPLTTKPDKDYHGYGVKGIRYIAEKYGGELRMFVSDNRFNSNIMIPLI